MSVSSRFVVVFYFYFIRYSISPEFNWFESSIYVVVHNMYIILDGTLHPVRSGPDWILIDDRCLNIFLKTVVGCISIHIRLRKGILSPLAGLPLIDRRGDSRSYDEFESEQGFSFFCSGINRRLSRALPRIDEDNLLSIWSVRKTCCWDGWDMSG